MIAQMAMENGEVVLTDLVTRFQVTETSIRRDLTVLEKEGKLKRIRKGAVPYLQSKRTESFSEKAMLNLAAKQRIGKAAADMIHPKDVVLFDSGTTTLQIIKHFPYGLQQSGSVTIMTNSISISQEMLGFPSSNLILLGGIFLPEHQATVGPQTAEQLQKFMCDYVFLGADGVSLDGGVTTANILMAEIDRIMVERARKAILVVDSSKFSHVGFVPVKPISEFDMIITDTDAPANIVKKIRESGVEVMTV